MMRQKMSAISVLASLILLSTLTGVDAQMIEVTVATVNHYGDPVDGRAWVRIPGVGDVGGQASFVYEQADGATGELSAKWGGVNSYLVTIPNIYKDRTYTIDAWTKEVTSESTPGVNRLNIAFITAITATVDIDPDALNLKSKGKWITCYIELPEGYDVAEIDVATILLNEGVPAESKPTGIGDYDNDGIADLKVKFSRSAVQDMLAAADEVQITATGEVTRTPLTIPFEGSDTIRVIH